MPEGRSTEYAMWRACERAGIRFPGITRNAWDNLGLWEQCKLLAYHQIREIEEAEYDAKKLEAMGPRMF